MTPIKTLSELEQAVKENGNRYSNYKVYKDLPHGGKPTWVLLEKRGNWKTLCRCYDIEDARSILKTLQQIESLRLIASLRESYAGLCDEVFEEGFDEEHATTPEMEAYNEAIDNVLKLLQHFGGSK